MDEMGACLQGWTSHAIRFRAILESGWLPELQVKDAPAFLVKRLTIPAPFSSEQNRKHDAYRADHLCHAQSVASGTSSPDGASRTRGLHHSAPNIPVRATGWSWLTRPYGGSLLECRTLSQPTQAA